MQGWLFGGGGFVCLLKRHTLPMIEFKARIILQDLNAENSQKRLQLITNNMRKKMKTKAWNPPVQDETSGNPG